MSRNEIELLLEKYLRGTISTEEAERLRLLSNLCDDSELNDFFSKQWDKYEGDAKLNREEVQQISERLHKKLYPARNTSFVNRWMRIAASILLLLTTGLSVYLMVDNRKMALLSEREVVVRVDKGQRADVTLPDGSTVRLNSESELSYRQDFGRQNRGVKLSGEGYFEVVKNPKKKFIVSTRLMDVEVLGTSFNFFAYEAKSSVELTLVEGRVYLSTNTTPAQTAILEPNSKAVYDKNTGKLNVERTNTVFETAWQAKELVFRSESLSDVLSKIERRYGVVINTEDQQMLKDTYTGVFDKEELSDVMKILSTHFGFAYTLKEDTVLIKKRE